MADGGPRGGRTSSRWWSSAAWRLLVATAMFRGTGLQSAPPPAPVPAPPAADEFERSATWSIPGRAEVRRRVFEWIAVAEAAGRKAGQQIRLADAARALWPTDVGGEVDDATMDLLDRVMATFSTIDPRCAVIQAAVRAGAPPAPPTWLGDPATDDFQQDAVRLWLGREYVRCERFDEGLSLLSDLDAAAAVDPASLLFHRAACQHWLLDADAAVESLDRLLERAGEIPVRYERMARLMRADLKTLEDESLDHISRRMRDITRRLDLGRAGPQTRRVQDGVIESLDKLIAAIEREQQQNDHDQSGGAGGGSSGGDGKPMDDSRIAGGKGPGEVTKREIGDGDGWGNLPPHKREEALQQIGREFPTHYREAIEQYFKRLASGDDNR